MDDPGAVNVTVAPDDVVLLGEAPASDNRLAALEQLIEAETAVNGQAERDT